MKPKWVVKTVLPLNEYKLLLSFEYGEQKIFDFSPLLNKKIYSPLKDKRLFDLVYADACGGVAWTCEIDMDPEVLYQDSIPYHC